MPTCATRKKEGNVNKNPSTIKYIERFFMGKHFNLVAIKLN
jgi:hypothetical protein